MSFEIYDTIAQRNDTDIVSNLASASSLGIYDLSAGGNLHNSDLSHQLGGGVGYLDNKVVAQRILISS